MVIEGLGVIEGLWVIDVLWVIGYGLWVIEASAGGAPAYQVSGFFLISHNTVPP